MKKQKILKKIIFICIIVAILKPTTLYAGNKYYFTAGIGISINNNFTFNKDPKLKFVGTYAEMGNRLLSTKLLVGLNTSIYADLTDVVKLYSINFGVRSRYYLNNLGLYTGIGVGFEILSKSSTSQYINRYEGLMKDPIYVPNVSIYIGQVLKFLDLDNILVEISLNQSFGKVYHFYMDAVISFITFY